MPVYRYVDKNFFKQWGSAMAYVLGFLFADGNIIITNRGTHYVSFHSCDRQLLVAIAHVMNASQKISKRSERSGNVYRLQIGSKEMVEDLIDKGLTIGKAKRMVIPAVPTIFVSDFIRGYFDGDGNVWVGKIHKSRTVPTVTLSVSFTSASKAFLVGLLHVAKKSGLQGGSVYSAQDGSFSRLSFGKYDSLKIYEIMYNTGAVNNLYLQRKKRVFENFLKMRT